MPVKFNNLPLVPAPLVTYSVNFEPNDKGKPKFKRYSISLTGTIVNIDTALDSNGASGLSGLSGVLVGQDYVRDVFSQEGLLQIISGEQELSFWAKPESISFEDGVWVNRSDYTINLSSDGITGDSFPEEELSAFSDSWSFSDNPDGTQNVTREISAAGFTWIDDAGENQNNFEYVKSFVEGKRDDASLIVGPSGESLGYWNRTLNATYSQEAASYSVSISYIKSDTDIVYTERQAWQVDFENTTETVTWDLSIEGLGFNVYDKVQKTNHAESFLQDKLEEYSLPSPYRLINENITRDKILGQISLSRTFSKGQPGLFDENSIEESVEITYQQPTDIVAVINIPGKPLPYIQNLLMQTQKEKAVSVSIRKPSVSGITLATLDDEKPNIETMMNELSPVSGYVSTNTETWNPRNGQYTRNKSWIYV